MPVCAWYFRDRAEVGSGHRHELLVGRAEVVEKQSYLLELIRYLVLNPMRTTPPLTERPESYPWSSYGALLGLTSRPPWLTIDWTLRWFGDDYAW